MLLGEMVGWAVVLSIIILFLSADLHTNWTQVSQTVGGLVVMKSSSGIVSAVELPHLQQCVSDTVLKGTSI